MAFRTRFEFDQVHSGQNGGVIDILPGELRGVLFNDTLRGDARRLISKMQENRPVDGEALRTVIGGLVLSGLEGDSHQARFMLCELYNEDRPNGGELSMRERTMAALMVDESADL